MIIKLTISAGDRPVYSCTTDAALAAAELVWRVAGAEVLEQETSTSEEARWADIKISTPYLHYLHNIYSGAVTRSWARLAPAPGAARVVVECVSLDTVHSAADSLTVQLQCE